MLFDVFKDFSRSQNGRVVTAIFFGQMPRKKIVIRLAAESLPRQTDLVLIILIGVNQSPFQVFAKHVERQTLDERSVSRLRMPQIVVRPFSGKGVADRMLKNGRFQFVLDQVILRPCRDAPAAANASSDQSQRTMTAASWSYFTNLGHGRGGITIGFGKCRSESSGSATFQAGQSLRQRINAVDRETDSLRLRQEICDESGCL